MKPLPSLSKTLKASLISSSLSTSRSLRAMRPMNCASEGEEEREERQSHCMEGLEVAYGGAALRRLTSAKSTDPLPSASTSLTYSGRTREGEKVSIVIVPLDQSSLPPSSFALLLVVFLLPTSAPSPPPPSPSFPPFIPPSHSARSPSPPLLQSIRMLTIS